MHIHEHAELPVTRRAFLRRGVTMLGGAAIASAGVALAKECLLTPNDILGPMYNYGAPLFQRKLVGDDEPGEHLILSGTVYASDCSTPLPKTLIEIWQADAKGFYDNKDNGPVTKEPARLFDVMKNDDAAKDKRPGVIVFPEWWGLNDYAKDRAKQLGLPTRRPGPQRAAFAGHHW